MKYKVKMSSRFKKELKNVSIRKYNLELLWDVVETLAKGEPLAAKHVDHALSGNFAGMRECHITPDWLLIYQIQNDELVLLLSRTGTHSDLFKK